MLCGLLKVVFVGTARHKGGEERWAWAVFIVSVVAPCLTNGDGGKELIDEHWNFSGEHSFLATRN